MDKACMTIAHQLTKSKEKLRQYCTVRVFIVSSLILGVLLIPIEIKPDL